MKNIKLNLLALTAVLFLNVSCNDDENDYPLTSNLPVGTFSADKTTVVEYDDPLTSDYENISICNFTMDKPYKTDMKFKIELVQEGTTGTISDFSFNLPASGIDNGSDGYLLKVDKNTTNKVFTFTANFDDAADAVETFRFKITPAGDLNGLVNPITEFFTITVGNSTSNNLNILLDWDSSKTFLDVDGGEHAYDEFDFDLEVYNAGFAVTNTSYSSAPEKIQFSSGAADGTYYIVPSLYSSEIVDENDVVTVPMLPINFNVTLKVVKKGIFEKTIDLSGLWNTTVGGDQQGNPDAYQIAAYFEKVGNTYTLYDLDDNVLATGRTSDLVTMLKSKKRFK